MGVIKISKTNLGVEDKRKLLFECAGRCSICGESLDYDRVSRARVNIREYAHIIGDKPDGPRGNKNTSAYYAGDIGNIILLCPSCHTKVDKNTVFYTEDRLHRIKSAHIKKVHKLLDCLKNKEVLAVKYEVRIGDRVVRIDEDKMDEAIRESGFLSHEIPIDLNPNNTTYTDSGKEFWIHEFDQLEQNYKFNIEYRLIRGEVRPFLLFAIAPQPLLIKLGTLMNDTIDVHVFQKRREPDTWLWDDMPVKQCFRIIEPEQSSETIALKLSLSDKISDNRIIEVLGERTSIWEITHDNPHNDFIRHPYQLEALRVDFRHFFRMFRDRYGPKVKVHVFPACPVSAAIEFGRIWMPKVDAELILYDHNKCADNFVEAFSIIPNSERD